MAWCPNCKTEYREGVTVCSDCGTALVESLEKAAALDSTQMTRILHGGEEHIEAISKYLKAQRFYNYTILKDDDSDEYSIYVPTEDREQALVIVSEFLNKVSVKDDEEEVACQQGDCSANKKVAKRETTYRSAKDRAEDHKTSAYILLIAGILGIIALILMGTGVIPNFIHGTGAIIFYSVMGAFFGMFIIMSIVSFRSAKEYKKADTTEQDLLRELDAFCEKNLTAEQIDSKVRSLVSDDSQLFFVRAEYMRRCISDEYENLSPLFLEDYIDKKYGEIFE